MNRCNCVNTDSEALILLANLRCEYLNNHFSIRFLYLYVFITGASVMAIEIAASRFLAPYFGTSMIVWANIIGLILLSLSLGYWVGGKWADRWPSGKLLMILSLLSGVLVSLLPLWGNFIFQFLTNGIMNTPVWIIFCSFFAVLIVFAPPVFLLAMVSPFAIRLVSDQSKDIGRVAGNLYACSTLGSLLGTFGTAMITIPLLGARESIYIWSAALIAISGWGLRHTKQGWLVSLLLVPVLSYFFINDNVSTSANEKVLWSKDTFYQYVRVVEASNGDISLVYNEGGGVQSIRRAKPGLHAGDYYNDYLVLPYLTNSPDQLLVLGSAGGTIPRLLAEYVKPQFPNMNVTGVELDPEVITLSYQYMGLKREDAQIVNQDARVFISNTNRKYDIIVVDCYSQQIYIPAHLSTVQFFDTLRMHLNPDGLTALNVNVTTPDSPLLLAMAKTVKQVFPNTYIVKSSGQYNYMIIGSIRPLQTDNLNRVHLNSPIHPLLEQWQKGIKEVNDELLANAQVLTDNHAPTEMLTDSMIFGSIPDRP